MANLIHKARLDSWSLEAAIVYHKFLTMNIQWSLLT